MNGLTAVVLQQVMPRAPRVWLDVMEDELPKWGIDTTREVSSFVAQVAHESNELTRLEENLNYSAERLMQVWQKRFPSFDIAQKYEHMPEKLANFVYANRMGNGDAASGDGFVFHGRGPIQLTGRRNYEEYGIWLGEDLIAHPELLLAPVPGIKSAIWFWSTNNLDVLDDDDDVRLETSRINGGETGLVRRQAYFDQCLKLMEAG
jgi:putative chitinase